MNGYLINTFVLCWVTQPCLTLCKPVDCSPPGSSVYGDSPGKNTGVGCHALLQGIFPTQVSNPGLPHGRWILYYLSHQGSHNTCLVTWTQCLILSRLIKLKGTLIWHEFYVLLLPKPPPTQRKEGKQAGRQEKKSSRCANEKLRYLFKNFAICMNYLFQSFLGSWFHRIVGV